MPGPEVYAGCPFMGRFASRGLAPPLRRPEGWPPYAFPGTGCAAGCRGRRPLQAAPKVFVQNKKRPPVSQMAAFILPVTGKIKAAIWEQVVAFCFAQILLGQPVEGGVPDTRRRSPVSGKCVGRPALWPPQRGGKTPACKSAHKRGIPRNPPGRACPAPTALPI